MTTHENLLGGPPPTLIPDEPAPREKLAAREPTRPRSPRSTRPRRWPGRSSPSRRSPVGRSIEGYAYARTGYHRGLDALRRSGWKGHGPVPWEHEPNRGFLRALHALGRAAGEIGEDDEAQRCRTFLADSSLTAQEALDAGPAA